ncbi:PKD domain containing protein [Indibacter alkaliphilus LW1]|uniref:PKD domain containing protein n=1 Tax=Indibacter alkaliphilus (strain CCUG 57479 / KCTC 22604 / LW1) TaxID=1189612 RepID=S2D8V2_INDAL|nr:PKD domain containing protein [Indibacter alkaliphilus LW1]
MIVKKYFLLNYHLNWKKVFFFLGILLYFFLENQTYAQLAIPRAGFPYCQPFTDTGDPNDLEFTIAKGNTISSYNPLILSDDRSLVLTGESIELTPSSENERGYVLIDLPFSSEYGIKASFEYFINSPSLSADLGDGLSFFLIDGEVNESEFQIGGVGGSLGYAPHGSNANGATYAGGDNYNYTTGGVTGGYMGIGFDVLGNFGNFQEKRYGGFSNPDQFNFSTPNNDIEFYPNSVVIRGPLVNNDNRRKNGDPPPVIDTTNPQYNSYQFRAGKIVFFDPSDDYGIVQNRVDNGVGSLPSNSPYFMQNSQFRIGNYLSPSDVDCEQQQLPPGYRKVYIDLKPTGIPSEPYDVTVDVLVGNNPVPVNIFNNIRYQGIAPQTLKVGFAASTGAPFYSRQEIRNVAVQVSSLENAQQPNPPSLERTICIEDSDDVDFPFCVELPSSANAFIQCINLFQDDPGAADNDFTNTTQFGCGLDDVCGTRCQDIPELPFFQNGVLVGTFFADLEDLDTDNFEERRTQARIRFEPVPGFFGTITAYYKVVDNFGLESDGIPITITINPLPEFVDFGNIQEPTCDGQSDGAIDGVVVENLVEGYEVRWYDGQGNQVNPDLYTADETNVGGYIRAILGLNGVNLGSYSIEIFNPTGDDSDLLCSDEFDDVDVNTCFVTHDFPEITQERGTPVILVDPVDVICELTPLFIQADVDQVYRDNVPGDPEFLWYTDENRQFPIQEGNQLNINGNLINTGAISISADGLISFASLPQGNYSFFVDIMDTDFPDDGNFCMSRGEMTRIDVTVVPELTGVVSAIADLCREEIGSIAVDVDGGQGAKTYNLYREGENDPIRSEVSNANQFTFENLLPGVYEVEVFTQNPSCLVNLGPVEVEGPEFALEIEELSILPASCGEDNGEFSFRINGGNLSYGSHNPQISGGTFENWELDPDNQAYNFFGLQGGVEFTVTIDEGNGCTISYSFNVPDTPEPVFDIIGDRVICENEDAVSFTVDFDFFELQNEASPVFIWYEDEERQNPIAGGTGPFGFDYSIDSNTGSLEISNLSIGEYSLFLEMTGPFTCEGVFERLDFSVNPLPEPIVFREEAALCFGSVDGIIEMGLTEGDIADFEFALQGLTDFQDSPVFSNNIAAGSYIGLVRNKSTGCVAEIDITIDEPELLEVISLGFQDPTCGDFNGVIEFSVSGGTAPYNVFINGSLISNFDFTESDGNYRVTNLEPISYIVEVEDSFSCLAQIDQDFDLVNNEGFEIFSNPLEDEICEGANVEFTPDLDVPTGASPELKWYFDAAATQEVSSGSIGGLTYAISDDGVLTVSGLDPGSYTYYLEISGENICTLISTAEVNVLQAIDARVNIENINCFGDTDGIINIVNVIGGSGDFEFSLNGVDFQTEPIFENLAPGNYTLNIRDVNSAEGCFLEISDLSIESPEAPISLERFEVFRASCGEANGRIFNVDVQGGWGNYSFEWRSDDPDSGELLTQGSIEELDGIFPGTYYLIVQDENGCVSIFDFEVGALSDPEYALVPPMDVCFGDDVLIRPVHLAPDPSLPPAAATEVFWYKEANRQGLIEDGVDSENPEIVYAIDDSSWINPELRILGLAPGDYTFYFYVACTDVEIPVEVTVHPIPEPIFESQRVSCHGANDGRILLSGLGGDFDVEFSVNGGDWISQEELEELLFSPNTYSIETRSVFGCSPEIQIIEIEGPEPLNLEFIALKDASCLQKDGNIEVAFSGGWPSYALILTNLDNGNSLELSLGETGTFVFENLGSGTYEVTLTDAEGCLANLSDPVVIEDLPTEIVIDERFDICEDETLTLSPEINPDATERNFRWYRENINPANELSDGQNEGGVSYSIDANGFLSISGLESRSQAYVFWVTVEGPEVCEGDSKELEVFVYQEPVFTADVIDEVCFGEGGSILINPEVNVSDLEISINGGGFQSYPDNRIDNLNPGSYFLEARHASGCTYILEDDLLIEGPDSALELLDIQTLDTECEENAGRISGTMKGGIAPYEIQLTDASGNALNLSPEITGDDFVFANLPSGDYILVLEDALGCIVREDQIIVSDIPTLIDVDDLISICEGETAVLMPSINVSGANPEFLWFSDPDRQTPVISNQAGPNGESYEIDAAGTLRVRNLPVGASPYFFYVGAQGEGVCGDDLEQVEVIVNELPQLRVSNPSIVCDPTETVDLTRYIEGFDADLYDYIVVSPSGNSLRLDELEEVSSSGNYSVQVSTKGSDCYTPAERILVIIAEEEVIANFDYQLDIGGGNIIVNQDINILEDVEFTDLSTGDVVIWNWDFGDGAVSSQQNPIHQYQEKGIYTIRLTTIDVNGCQSEFTRVVQVYDDYLIEIPTAFTPSRTDGKNNYFKPVFRGIASMKLYVFNTWGDLIYETDSLEDRGWDGTLNGTMAPNGNYVYKAEFETRGGETIVRTGVFMLLR